MRFYTQPHPCYGGIDLHARTMYLCILNQEGEIVLHREMKAAPEPFLKAIAPSRQDLVVCVECIFTWDWLADLCTHEGIPFGLGHALYMKAIHGGKANNDTIDAHKIAVLLRGGMLPQASGYPAELRATRDLLRRRIHLRRTRAELLTHGQHTNSQDHLPESSKKIAYKANRDGVAERFPDPAVQKSLSVDLGLLDDSDHRLTDVERSIVQTAQAHDAQTCSRLRSIPGVGKIVALVRRYEGHDMHRFPRVQEFVSSGRLVKCAKESVVGQFDSGRLAGRGSPVEIDPLPKTPLANATGAPVRTLGMPLSHGPSPRLPCCSCATIRRASSPSRASRKNMARGTP